MTGTSCSASLCFCIVLIFTAIALMSAALGTPRWVTFTVDILGVSGHFGLFEYCTSGVCLGYKSDSFQGNDFYATDINVVKGLSITAVIVYGANLLIIGHLLLVQKLVISSKHHGWACLGVTVLAAVLAGSGAIYFVIRVEEEVDKMDPAVVFVSWSYGPSLYLAWVSGVVNILAGIFAAVSVGNLFSNQAMAGHVIQPFPLVAPTVQVVTTTNLGYPPVPQFAAPNQGGMPHPSTSPQSGSLVHQAEMQPYPADKSN